MDKLQPILKHHFWILAFLVLPLGIWGYYSANSSLNAATQAREDQLNTAFNAIPEGNSPNSTWEAAKKVQADEYEVLMGDEILALYKGQESLMDWPPIMAPFKPAEYRGAWDLNRQSAYHEEYEELMRDVWERYQPVDTTLAEGADRSRITWDEKVIIDPVAILPVHQFGNLRATDEQIWDAQEDIWLHRMIADAVVRTNEDADGPYTATVRSVLLIELMGGDGGKPVAAGSGQSGQSGQNSGATPGADDYGQAYGGGGRGGGRRGSTTAAVAFDPAEEIGGGGRAASSSRGRAGYSGTESAGPMGGGRSGEDNATTGTTVLRYVGANQNDKSRVRAFYMSVIVDQTKFPEFLVELCNSDWPIEIVRFNIGPNPNYVSPMLAGRSGVMGGYGGGNGGSNGPMGGIPMGNRPSSGARPPMSSGGPMIRTTGPMGGSSGPMGGVDGAGRRQTHESFGALESSNLVQLDLLGLITIFNPSDRPEETEELASTNDASAEETPEESEDDGTVDDAASQAGDAPADDSTPMEALPESSEETTDESATEVEEAETAADESSQSTDQDDSEGTPDPAAASESVDTLDTEETAPVEESSGVE